MFVVIMVYVIYEPISTENRRIHSILIARETFSILSYRGGAGRVLENFNFLMENAVMLMEKSAKKRNDLVIKERELHRRRGDFEEEKKRLMNIKMDLNTKIMECERDITQHEETLNYYERELKRSKSDLQTAKYNLEAEKKEKKRREATIGWAEAAGLITSLFVWGLPGLAIVPVVGIIDLVTIRLIDEEIKRVHARIRHAENDILLIQRDINGTLMSLSYLKEKNEKLKLFMRENQRKFDKCHKELNGIKGSLTSTANAIHSLELDIKLIQHAKGCTKRLRKFIEKASEKEDLEVLGTEGITNLALTFMNAWEAIAL